MTSMRMHLGPQRVIVLVCAAVSLAISPGARADSPPTTGEKPASEATSSFADVLTAGARLFGRGSRQQNKPAEQDAATDSKGTSSAAARKAATAALPIDKLVPESRERVQALLKSVSFFRRLPTVSFPVEPEVYQYFVAHPDVAVSIWRAMKISKLQMWQTGRHDYEADAGDGSVGKLEVLHTGENMQVVVCDGLYKSPLFNKPIEARSLLVLHTGFARDEEGTMHATHRADLFVSFPSTTVDVVAKIFSPLAIAMTDRTFSEISLFLRMMSQAMTTRPDWVENVASKMDGVPELRKSQVLELTTQVYAAAQKSAMERMIDREGTPAGSRPSTSNAAATKPGTARIVKTEKSTGDAR